MADVKLQNAYARTVHDLQLLMTLRGVEYEFEWYESGVLADNGRVWLRVTTPAAKYTLVSFREIRHSETRGFYRQYREGNFSGGTVDRSIIPVQMRGDSPVGSQGTFDVMTGVTADPANAFSQVPLWGSSGPGSNEGQGVGLNPSSAARLIPPGSVVLLEFENNSPNAADWYAYFKQWEIKPAAIPEPGDL